MNAMLLFYRFEQKLQMRFQILGEAIVSIRFYGDLIYKLKKRMQCRFLYSLRKNLRKFQALGI